MKKIIISLFMASLASAYGNTSNVSIKSGFRAGATFGLNFYESKLKATFQHKTMKSMTNTTSTTIKSTKPSMGIHGAYDWVSDRFYSSVEFSYHYNFIKKAKESKFSPDMGPGKDSENIKYQLSQQLYHDAGLQIHLGGLITNQWATYAIVGGHMGWFKNSFDTRGNKNLKNVDKSFYTFGYEFGIGTRYQFSHDWAFAVEGTYKSYVVKSFGYEPPEESKGTYASIKVKSKPHIFGLFFKISRTF